MNNPTPPPHLHIGAAYYPEHWPEERWPRDMDLMKQAHFSVVRMAEFAWSTMEPAEGEFHFDWLERAIAMLAERGIATVLGTPTAAPPAWLTFSHPATLAVDEYGRKAQHGNRWHYCPTSTGMRAASRRITRAMARRFGSNPAVVGWQTDNELGRVCYCDNCRRKFQAFLKKRYGTLDRLNSLWSTAYWSQTYSDWRQIPIPIGAHNPGLMLEWKRFITRNNREFQKEQVDILRRHIRPGVWISHNFMGWFGGFDHYQMAADLDMASWDYYVGSGHHEYLGHGITHDLTRGFLRKNFWVMETQPGSVNWAGVNNSLNRWEARSMAWQAVAHGADGLLYWQWRSAPGGQEQYHGSLLDQSGQPRPFFTEVEVLGQEFARLSELVAGSTVRAQVALLNDYDSRWSVDFQRHHKDFDYVAYFNHFARQAAAHNQPVDVISADGPLTGYRVVFAPALVVLDEGRIANLKEFVQRGGTLVLTARCGMKDRYNALLPQRQPAGLADLAGVEVEEYFALDEAVPVKGNFFMGSAKIWAERLKLRDEKSVAVVAHYRASNGWLDDRPAVTVRSHRGGFVYYVGAWLDDYSQKALVAHILEQAIGQAIETPTGVEIRTRVRGDGQEIYFLINHERQEHTVRLPWTAHDHLGGQDLEGEFSLAPYSVCVLTRIEAEPAGEAGG
jgi:beta-galactosidase